MNLISFFFLQSIQFRLINYQSYFYFTSHLELFYFEKCILFFFLVNFCLTTIVFIIIRIRMKRLSFNNTSNELDTTMVRIENDEHLFLFVTSDKYIALIVSIESISSLQGARQVRVFDRTSGLQFS